MLHVNLVVMWKYVCVLCVDKCNSTICYHAAACIADDHAVDVQPLFMELDRLCRFTGVFCENMQLIT